MRHTATTQILPNRTYTTTSSTIQKTLARIHNTHNSILSLNYPHPSTTLNFDTDFNNLLREFNKTNTQCDSLISLANQRYENDDENFNYSEAINDIQNNLSVLPLLHFNTHFNTLLEEFNTITTQCDLLISLNDQRFESDDDDFNYTDAINAIGNDLNTLDPLHTLPKSHHDSTKERITPPKPSPPTPIKTHTL